MNRLVWSINALNQKKSRAYDSRGYLAKVTDTPSVGSSQPVITSAEYNAKGQIKCIVDPEGNAQYYDYDNLGRLVKETTPAGSVISYGYNALNQLETKVNGRNQKTSYQYDAAGRLKVLIDEVDHTEYKYDANGNLTDVIGQNAGHIYREYDALNRVKSYTDASGNKIVYEYDEVGNLTGLIYPNGKKIEYRYDRSGLLKKVIDFDGGVTEYFYDANRKIEKIIYANGITLDAVYDEAGQLKSKVEKDKKGKVITSYSYEYDAEGNIKEEIQQSGTPQLTKGTITMEYGKGNKLIKFNGQDVAYDADGNMTYGPLGGKMVNFTYDARNRLIKAGSTTYLYDAENNRIGKIENGVKTSYVINTNAQLTEVLQEKKGSTVRSYIYGLGLIMHVEGGEYATYHFDNRGSTVAITNSKGAVTDTFTYGPYGEQAGRTGKTYTPFLFNGKYGVQTDANGLYYMRMRYYNPTIKRFINQDVIKGSLDNAISVNRYAYANGNSVSKIDPFGLATQSYDEAVKKAQKIYDKRAREIEAQYMKTMDGEGMVSMWDNVSDKDIDMLFHESYLFWKRNISDKSDTLQVPYKNAVDVKLDEINIAVEKGYLIENSRNYKILMINARVFTFDTASMIQLNSGYIKSQTVDQAFDAMTVKALAKHLEPKACFTAGTLVVTQKGKMPIEKIKTGDFVWAENPETGERGLKKVVKTFIREKSVLVHVYVNDIMIETTEEHPFWVEGKGWVVAGELRVGDVLRLKSDKNVSVTKLSFIYVSKPVKVYNFEVEDWHTYFVSDEAVLVHNAKCLPGSAEGTSSTGQGFKTFNEAKKALGSPGEGNAWHHIVEQSQIKKSGFDPTQIHNINNLIAVDKATHAKISGYYSSKQAFTGGKTVRDWLAGQSFEAQFEFGIDVLKKFGVIK